MSNLGIVFRPQVAPERLRAAALAAEAAGVDELWLWEDCFDHGGVATTAAALAWTTRLQVGIGVLPVPLRNVALTAMEVASLARMFPGRVHVGVGHGVQEWMGRVGVRAESPMTLLREYVTALQALLAGEQVTMEGRYVRLSNVQLGWVPTAKPDLHLAATRAKTVALSGELGDGTILTSASSIDDVRAARAAIDGARGSRPGRARLTVNLETGSDDADSAAARVNELYEAGADTVVLEPPADDDDVESYARFAAEQVRPQLR